MSKHSFWVGAFVFLAYGLQSLATAQDRGTTVTGNTGPVLNNNSIGGNVHLTINQGWDVNRASVARQEKEGQSTWQEAASAAELLNRQLSADLEFSKFLVLLTGATGTLHVDNALKQLDAAAEKGSSLATMVSAVSYWNGWWGRPKDPNRGRKLFEQAAERGSPGGQIWVGANLWNGENGYAKDPVRANQYLVTLVNNENALRETRAEHATYLGNRYLSGTSVAKNECLGIRYLGQGAALGSPLAMRQLGFEREFQSRCLPQDKAEALNWFEKGALAGDADSAYHAGRLHHFGSAKGRDYAAAERLYLKAGTPSANGMLSWLYSKGLHDPERRPDFNKAFNYARRAADGGDLLSMVMLGQYYQYGFGVSENVYEAFRWYGKASDSGDVRGKVHQAVLIQKGCVGPEQMPSWVEEMRSISDSADADIAARTRALNLLGAVYMSGTAGVAADRRRALSFFERSCKLGYPQGCENYVAQNQGGKLSKEMQETLSRARGDGSQLSGDSCNQRVAELSSNPDMFP